MIKKKKNAKLQTKRAILSKDYSSTLLDLKQKVAQAQLKAALSVNKELIKLYWAIGHTIVKKQTENGWGSNLIERLAHDLQKTSPGIGGFSRSNIFNMKAFYSAYTKVQQPAGLFEELPIFNIPWWHNILLLTKIKDTNQRLWYAQKTIEFGWSRSALEDRLQSDLYHREGKAVTNFKHTLPNPHSMLAQQTLKDPYVFDFLTLKDEYVEQDLEQGLIDHVQKFLIELGEGFAFVGRQYHVEVGASDFYIDLLFYHLNLRCYVVVELKTTKFEPEYAGKLNFYLSAIDSKLRKLDDKPTIGLLLCKTKDNVVAEYALRDISKPIGVAGYATAITKKLPKELKSNLPSIAEIEAELEQKMKIVPKATKKNKKSLKKK